jgi:hypothetical protein
VWKEKVSPAENAGPGSPNTHLCQENEGNDMFRKITLVAVPAVAVLLTLFVTETTSQAFAKGGGRGGHGAARNHRGFDRNFRNFNRNRYGWGYGSYGYFGFETPVCESAVCEPIVAAAVVEAPVAPVCTTCEPTSEAVYSGYAPYWGRDYRNHFRNHGRSFGNGGHRGGRGR